MKKFILSLIAIASFATVAFTSCSSDDPIADNTPNNNSSVSGAQTFSVITEFSTTAQGFTAVGAENDASMATEWLKHKADSIAAIYDKTFTYTGTVSEVKQAHETEVKNLRSEAHKAQREVIKEFYTLNQTYDLGFQTIDIAYTSSYGFRASTSNKFDLDNENNIASYKHNARIGSETAHISSGAAEVTTTAYLDASVTPTFTNAFKVVDAETRAFLSDVSVSSISYDAATKSVTAGLSGLSKPGTYYILATFTSGETKYDLQINFTAE